MHSRDICCVAPFIENSELYKMTADFFGKFDNVETVGVKYAKEIPESVAEFAYAVPGVMEKAREKEADGYRGIIIGCAGDTGYLETREVVSIPVVAPGHASMVLANMIGYKFSILVPDEMMVIPTERLIRLYGLSDSLSSIRCVPQAIIETGQEDPAKTINDTIDKIIECIEKDRASVIILGCLAMVRIADSLRKAITPEYNVAIINPVDAAFCMVNVLMNMKHNY